MGVDDKVPVLEEIIAEEDAKAGEMRNNVKEDESASVLGLHILRKRLQGVFSSEIAPKPAVIDSSASSKLTASLGIPDLPHGARPTHYLALKLTTPATVDAVVDVQVRFSTYRLPPHKHPPNQTSLWRHFAGNIDRLQPASNLHITLCMFRVDELPTESMHTVLRAVCNAQEELQRLLSKGLF